MLNSNLFNNLTIFLQGLHFNGYFNKIVVSDSTKRLCPLQVDDILVVVE